MRLDLLDFFPIWVTTLLIAGLLLVACDLAYRHARRKGDTEKSDEGHVLSAMLALLGLLVGFTFSIAVSRHELRRTLVVDEANAIGTEYLRTQMLPEPYRSRLAAMLRSYTDARLALADAGEDSVAIGRANAITDSLQRAMWATTVEVDPLVQPPALSSLIAGGMNAVIDVAATRRAALEARLPTIAFGSLVLFATVAAAMLGFVSGSGHRRSRAGAIVLLLLLGLALGLILDMDRPRRGTIKVSQQPLIDLQRSMRGR
ncbi:MAG: hypothetical protein JF589_05680 [Gemmatimonadetes bacterium]|nr:hypothetical protein [Gemmatimonadota bacterium]